MIGERINLFFYADELFADESLDSRRLVVMEVEGGMFLKYLA